MVNKSPTETSRQTCNRAKDVVNNFVNQQVRNADGMLEDQPSAGQAWENFGAKAQNLPLAQTQQVVGRSLHPLTSQKLTPNAA